VARVGFPAVVSESVGGVVGGCVEGVRVLWDFIGVAFSMASGFGVCL
jgi:hypothetical protein